MKRTLIGSACCLAAACCAQPAAEERRNWFDDPFVQVTAGIAACPVPRGPEITAAERIAESHYRVERGVSCYQAGRCRLPNAYLYDREIIPRVAKAIDATGLYGTTTSVWAEGQRRWVWLKGCVRQRADALALVELVRNLDDVEGVVDELALTPGP